MRSLFCCAPASAVLPLLLCSLFFCAPSSSVLSMLNATSCMLSTAASRVLSTHKNKSTKNEQMKNVEVREATDFAARRTQYSRRHRGFCCLPNIQRPRKRQEAKTEGEEVEEEEEAAEDVWGGAWELRGLGRHGSEQARLATSQPLSLGPSYLT